MLRPRPLQVLNKNGLSSNPRRTFFPPSPFASKSDPQTISHSAILPYAPGQLYRVIADIPSYPTFLPFCTSAEVVSRSHPDHEGNRWPALASLSVGWGGISETYVSRVYCVPGRVVEAIAGDVRTGLGPEELRIYRGLEGMGVDAEGRHVSAGNGSGGDIFRSLRTRWELSEVSQGRSKVDLSIEFDFKNPMYKALSGAAVPKIAGHVVHAFEKRAREVLG